MLSLTPSIRFPNTRETNRESGESSESFRTAEDDHKPGLSHPSWFWSRTFRITQGTQTVSIARPDSKDGGRYCSHAKSNSTSATQRQSRFNLADQLTAADAKTKTIIVGQAIKAASFVTVAGSPALVGTAGKFSAQATPTSGTNLFPIVAHDVLACTAESLRA